MVSERARGPPGAGIVNKGSALSGPPRRIIRKAPVPSSSASTTASKLSSTSVSSKAGNHTTTTTTAQSENLSTFTSFNSAAAASKPSLPVFAPKAASATTPMPSSNTNPENHNPSTTITAPLRTGSRAITSATAPTASSRAKRAAETDNSQVSKRLRTTRQPPPVKIPIKPPTSSRRLKSSTTSTAARPTIPQSQTGRLSQQSTRPISANSAPSRPTALVTKPPIPSTTRTAAPKPVANTTATRLTAKRTTKPSVLQVRRGANSPSIQDPKNSVVVPVLKRARVNSSHPDNPSTVIQEPVDLPSQPNSPVKSTFQFRRTSSPRVSPSIPTTPIMETILEDDPIEIDQPTMSIGPSSVAKISTGKGEIAPIISVSHSVSVPNLLQAQSHPISTRNSLSSSRSSTGSSSGIGLKRSLTAAFPSKIPVPSPRATPKYSPNQSPYGTVRNGAQIPSPSTAPISFSFLDGVFSEGTSAQPSRVSSVKPSSRLTPLSLETPSRSTRSATQAKTPLRSPQTPTFLRSSLFSQPLPPTALTPSRESSPSTASDFRSYRSMGNLTTTKAADLDRPLHVSKSNRFDFAGLSKSVAKPFVFRDPIDFKTPQVGKFASTKRGMTKGTGGPQSPSKSTNCLVGLANGNFISKANVSPVKFRSMSNLHSSPIKSPTRSSRWDSFGRMSENVIPEDDMMNDISRQRSMYPAPPSLYGTSLAVFAYEDAAGDVTPEATIAMEDFINSPQSDDDSGHYETVLQEKPKPLQASRSGNIPHLSPKKEYDGRLSPVKASLRKPQRYTMSPKKSVSWGKPSAQFSSTLSPVRARPPQPSREVLRNAVIFLDVYDHTGQSCAALFTPLLEELGAKCVPSWSSRTQQVTHVLFNDGEARTLSKVVASNGTVKCVNIGWPLDCERAMMWLDESPYLLDLSRLTAESGIEATTAQDGRSSSYGTDRKHDRSSSEMTAANKRTPKPPGLRIQTQAGYADEMDGGASPFNSHEANAISPTTAMSLMQTPVPVFRRPGMVEAAGGAGDGAGAGAGADCVAAQLDQLSISAGSDGGDDMGMSMSMRLEMAGGDMAVYYEDEPETPRFLGDPQSLLQMTCPPKQQTFQPMFGGDPPETPLGNRMLPKRHSMSLDFRPRVPSPLRNQGMV